MAPLKKLGNKHGLFLLGGALLAFVNPPSALSGSHMPAAEVDAWTRLFANVSRPDTVRGTIVASPTAVYYYNWIRDAALTCRAMVEKLSRGAAPTEAAKLKSALQDYISVTLVHQTTPTLAGLGEVKFLPTGQAFLGRR